MFSVCNETQCKIITAVKTSESQRSEGRNRNESLKRMCADRGGGVEKAFS
jgi:hypothetical protein